MASSGFGRGSHSGCFSSCVGLPAADLQDEQNVQDGQNSTALAFVFRLAVVFEPKKQFSAPPRLCVRAVAVVGATYMSPLRCTDFAVAV